MDPAFAFTVADLALDEAVRFSCACQVRTFTRGDLAALVGRDARLHLIGLQRELWCQACGEVPLQGWVVSLPTSRR